MLRYFILFLFIAMAPICSAQDIITKHGFQYKYQEQMYSKELIAIPLEQSETATRFYKASIRESKTSNILMYTGLATTAASVALIAGKKKPCNNAPGCETKDNTLPGVFVAVGSLGFYIASFRYSYYSRKSLLGAINQFNWEQGEKVKLPEETSSLEIGVTTEGVGLRYNF